MKVSIVYLACFAWFAHGLAFSIFHEGTRISKRSDSSSVSPPMTPGRSRSPEARRGPRDAALGGGRGAAPGGRGGAAPGGRGDVALGGGRGAAPGGREGAALGVVGAARPVRGQVFRLWGQRAGPLGAHPPGAQLRPPYGFGDRIRAPSPDFRRGASPQRPIPVKIYNPSDPTPLHRLDRAEGPGQGPGPASASGALAHPGRMTQTINNGNGVVRNEVAIEEGIHTVRGTQSASMNVVPDELNGVGARSTSARGRQSAHLVVDGRPGGFTSIEIQRPGSPMRTRIIRPGVAEHIVVPNPRPGMGHVSVHATSLGNSMTGAVGFNHGDPLL